MGSPGSTISDDKTDKTDGSEIGTVPSTPSDGSDAEKSSTLLSTPASPPRHEVDGGLRAWLQVLGSFLVFSNLWGFVFSFGSFQTFYEITYLPGQTPSNISWIGTIATFLLIVGGVLSGPLFDLGYFRAMLFLGAFLETLSVMMLSLCTEYYQILLSQGLLMGLGAGLLYIPGLALVGRSFKKHRSMAMAIVTCGAPFGGIIYTLMFEQLIGRMTFGWTVRIMGFVMLASYILAMPLLLFRVTNTGNLASGVKRKLFDPSAIKDFGFCWFTISSFFIFLGYMVPFIYMASYAQSSLGLSRSASLNNIIIAQACSVVGRLTAGYTATRVGVMIPWITCAAVSGVMCIAWIGANTAGTLTAVMALYGCFSGALIPLPPSVFPVVCPDPKVLGARLGMSQGITSVASLIGSPIAGALATIHANSKPGHINYLPLQLFTGVAMVFGAINLVGLWTFLVKKRGNPTFI